MKRLNVQPTRMALTKLKERLKASQRGHKLLKDKQDELMRRFISMVREANELRDDVEKRLRSVYDNTTFAKSVFPEEMMRNTFFLEKPLASVDIEEQNLMGLSVPNMTFKKEEAEGTAFLVNNLALKQASEEMADLLPDLLRLTELEQRCVLLADEIQKVRRRVNALEHLTIPRLQVTIRYIQMKLEEGERDNVTRLIKIKELEGQKIAPIKK
ncbi:V-type ATP synthase subunit D [Vagococcus lutrae]|uniref:V-type ATP synthase subunit D n=2 Tax=Vagococcus lutrae TaxID=81947 RepID=V6QDV1_9ENTE|nr:V-type ATP synthase subunit D [Vagococcus lutrae]MDO5741437.1 V-type ATP synthase subunit D [Vagococcus sp.]EST90758.1 hypothetical protein T233_00029 [Vagococcus lutrae LBD1]MCO7150103.1 V-type ATP synthase subunit D [Vagococcus lutrae]MDT2801160.1 V-type ATP synthase subunit D [Vagococcus lutrae]MDT2805584.1 V-type ATP synthase subunit D [Vagococcus lutrae]